MQGRMESGWGGEPCLSQASFPGHQKPSGNVLPSKRLFPLPWLGLQAQAGPPIKPVISLMSVNS